jgi:MoxR-like ATPase
MDSALSHQDGKPMEEVLYQVKKIIVGQDILLERLIVALLSRGHILVEGVPGLAKTMAIKTLADVIGGEFRRIQFTPDLVPADLIGTRIYNQKTGEFDTSLGPVMTNLLLADEINRAPAKVQSALLQAMEEKQVTIGDETHVLDHPFMVMATENPIEQEGTYPLPEAQLDRFFMKVLVDYPSFKEELEILNRFKEIDVSVINTVITPAKISEKAKLVDSIYIDEKLVEYIVTLVTETRQPSRKELKKYIEFGASPRASIAIMKASRCVAFMRGRGFVTPDDIKEIGADVLRHRIILTYEAEADGKGPDDVVRFLFDSVEVP